MTSEGVEPVTYEKIISVAGLKAHELRSTLPPLPSDKDLEPYEGRIWAVDRRLVDSVRRHLDTWGVAFHQGFNEHPSLVSKLSAFVADRECEEEGITGQLREEIIQRTWRLGLLHDLQRWRGYGPEHQIEGMKAAGQVLQDLGIKDGYLEDQILQHDKLEVETRNNPAFDIPFFSVFAVDHLEWGREWEKSKWEGFSAKGILPEKAIHDYKFMYRLLNSSNLQQTKWGRSVAIPYIRFGVSIAEHVKKTFSAWNESNNS